MGVVQPDVRHIGCFFLLSLWLGWRGFAADQWPAAKTSDDMNRGMAEGSTQRGALPGHCALNLVSDQLSVVKN